jgi:hypothetical protein
MCQISRVRLTHASGAGYSTFGINSLWRPIAAVARAAGIGKPAIAVHRVPVRRVDSVLGVKPHVRNAGLGCGQVATARKMIVAVNPMPSTWYA